MAQEFEVTCLADGLRFGDGAISTLDRLGNEHDPLNQEAVARLDNALESNDPRLLVPISEVDGRPIEDDGCGDGRKAGRLFKGHAKELKRSLHRAKVFGGGMVMAAAALIGRGKKSQETDLYDIFQAGQDLLDEHQLDYGAHTDNHASGDKSGCGAIDNAPKILQKATEFKDQIAATIGVLTDDKHQPEVLTDVQSNFTAMAERIKNKPYSGKRVMDKVREKDKVVKELEGDHRETHIIINTVAGTTVDQDFVRTLTDDAAQAFVVDEWRLRELSQELYSSEADQETAYISMLVYTLATAGTLTKGDLPVYVIAGSGERVAGPVAA